MEETTHYLFNSDSRRMAELRDGSVDLVVTSPPYPMIEMWDSLFSALDPEIGVALQSEDGEKAFSLMHSQLEATWIEVGRVLKPGGIACINIGDATRTVGGNFQLYPSHAIISTIFRSSGFTELPSIVWKKPSNSPNKFLGSGTLPVGAYVTLEHEYILIFRKQGKRIYTEDCRNSRAESAFFWEERNLWFSDVWDGIRGVRQELDNGKGRARSAAFPVQVPFRLINMYSVQGDSILDPFLGTGTTTLAAISAGRNSFGYEIGHEMIDEAYSSLMNAASQAANLQQERVKHHEEFVRREMERGQDFKYLNQELGLPVKTRPEARISIPESMSIIPAKGVRALTVEYRIFDGSE